VALRGRCAPGHRSDYQVLSLAFTSRVVKAPVTVTEAATPVERVVMARSCHSVAVWPLVLRPDARECYQRRPENGNGQRRVPERGKLVQLGGPLSALHVLKQD
jgi:hypothetical protein